MSTASGGLRCDHCGSPVALRVEIAGLRGIRAMWAEGGPGAWGDDRDFRCGVSDDHLYWPVGTEHI